MNNRTINNVVEEIENLINREKSEENQTQEDILKCPMCKEKKKKLKSDCCNYHDRLAQESRNKIIAYEEVKAIMIEEHEEHKCSFGFEDKRGLYEPKKGERGFSMKKNDWICRCGKTRREYLGVDD